MKNTSPSKLNYLTGVKTEERQSRGVLTSCGKIDLNKVMYSKIYDRYGEVHGVQSSFLHFTPNGEIQLSFSHKIPERSSDIMLTEM